LKRFTTKFKKNILRFLIPSGFYFSHDGFCPCCDNHVRFYSEDSWLRDSFVCSKCFSIPRERALIATIEKYFPQWRELSIHESSPGNRGASIKLRDNAAGYIASQFFPEHALGTVVEGFYNQDLERQTFDDGLFDIVVTQDVMEHVYNPAQAFQEIARTLKKGGAHIFTVPIINWHKPSEVWAVKGADNKPLFTHTPEWHGNPVNTQGSPVTMHWGYDIVDFIRNASGLETTVEYSVDLHSGIAGEFRDVFVSR
jgi:hypothetical protein